MELVQTLINAGVVAVVGVLVAAFVNNRYIDLRKELKEDIGDLKTEFREFKSESRTEFTEIRVDIRDLRAEMNDRFRDVNKEVSSLRSDVTQLALALGQRPQPQAG